MDWNTCIKEGSAIRTETDKKKIELLLNASKRKINFVNTHEINDSNQEILFSITYEGILELLHAFVMNDGYFVNNHICMGYYLKDIFRNKELFDIFDSCRIVRNNVIYTGEVISVDFAKRLIRELNYLNEEIIRVI
ncbi:hypothetical protein J4476_05160 [Candidatus Woesearchaeota archaeon]|nr:MAG: hypothetical protein QT09_C0004G0097 [archaeon GW2011_AR18]MBS3162053.1 hypothetical protein [Candidatus Woesearchaeota archaeon]HIH25908.1 hypothetical protein [Nanoarchaeota archaeon]